MAIVLLENQTLRFVFFDLVFVQKRQPDVVEALQQTLAAKRIDLKAEPAPLIIAHPLSGQINCQFVTGTSGGSLEEFIDLFFRKHDREHAVLETVVVEDVRERRRNDRMESIIKQGPRRVLARGPASEVRACHEYRRTCEACVIQLEAGLRRAVGIEPAVIEQKLTEAAALD